MTDANQLIQQAQTAQANGNDHLALDYYHQALQQYPNETSLQIVCGNLCVKLARHEEAAGHFRRILRATKSPEVRNALCYALQSLGNEADQNGQYRLAEASFEEALLHQPNNAVYWYNLGNAQRELGKQEAAMNSFKKAIQADPNDADAYNNLGNVQRELGHLDLAIANYRKALSINPDLHHALAHLVHQRQHICDWHGEGKDNLHQQIAAIRTQVNHNPSAQISPFAFLAMPGTTAEEQKRCASQYITQHYNALFHQQKQLAFKQAKTDKTKINIGYMSADFRLHPLAFLIMEMIEQHDRDQFRIIAYSYGPDDQTEIRKRFVAAFDQFIDIRGMSDIEAASKIHQNEIDILVDLSGFTQNSRTGIVALRPAAIHINWLGYPGTMGAYEGKALFDYVIADHVIAPDPHAFSETICYLPCYQPNGNRVKGQPSHKSDHNLPEDSFVFCCFNQTFKITADIFAIWMRLLTQTPDSVLWLLDCNQWAKANLIQEAERAGIDQSRLIFAPRSPIDIHLERQRHADLFLDTLPYNAHTTASDALWAGVPVITCKGDTFPARVSASLLTHIGLEALITDSLVEYEQKALSLAHDPEALAQLKTHLQHKIAASDLFKPEKFARSLESQYHAIWLACKAS